jgi:hypothetical protein
MKLLITLIIFSLLFSTACIGDNPEKVQVRITGKQGESCLVDQKCKVTVSRWETGKDITLDGGNVYYRCLLSSDLYNATVLEDKILLNLKNCERIPQE